MSEVFFAAQHEIDRTREAYPGNKLRFMVAAEECGEFIQACSKALRANHFNRLESKHIDAIRNEGIQAIAAIVRAIEELDAEVFSE